MAVFCICGVCIPYNAIWPFLLLALRPLWDWLKKVLGMETKGSSADNQKNDTTVGGSCCSGADKSTKKKSSAFPQEHFDLTEADTLPGTDMCVSSSMHVRVQCCHDTVVTPSSCSY
jgi:hypothetical protein